MGGPQPLPDPNGRPSFFEVEGDIALVGCDHYILMTWTYGNMSDMSVGIFLMASQGSHQSHHATINGETYV